MRGTGPAAGREIAPRVARRTERWRIGAVAATIVLATALVIGHREARSDPVVRRTTMALPDWPRGQPAVTVALIGDIHVGSRAMDTPRLNRIVDQINALAPDLVVIAGDFVFGHDPQAAAGYATMLTAPLSRLRTPMGTVAVLGNHDHWTVPAAVARALRRAGATVLANQAVERGPLAIVGIDDAFSGHALPARAMASALPLRGARVVVSHAPDVIGQLRTGEAPLVLTAHTHCGQAVLFGLTVTRSPLTGQRLFDPHYRCGIVHDPDRTVIVTAGLGTSIAPIRIGAPPDLWLITLGPSRGSRQDVSRSRP